MFIAIVPKTTKLRRPYGADRWPATFNKNRIERRCELNMIAAVLVAVLEGQFRDA